MVEEVSVYQDQPPSPPSPQAYLNPDTSGLCQQVSIIVYSSFLCQRKRENLPSQVFCFYDVLLTKAFIYSACVGKTLT